MNNLPAMTEAQRQELIADCNLDILKLTLLIEAREKQGINDIESKSALERQQIALASLTAEPVKTKLKYSSALPKFIGDTNEVESVHCWVHGDTPEFATNEEAYAEAQKMTGDLYTAPPAPVLRVPAGWIKCSERMPELGQEVLIRIPVCEKFNIENGKYEGDGRFLGAWFDTRGKGRPYKVTHWMPLPPPPPEASNEQ